MEKKNFSFDEHVKIFYIIDIMANGRSPSTWRPYFNLQVSVFFFQFSEQTNKSRMIDWNRKDLGWMIKTPYVHTKKNFEKEFYLQFTILDVKDQSLILIFFLHFSLTPWIKIDHFWKNIFFNFYFAEKETILRPFDLHFPYI